MLRIHLTAADVARVRVVVLGPLAEVQLSFTRLPRAGSGVPFDAWRSRTLAGADTLSPDVRDVARFVAPGASGLVDLFSLVGPAEELAEGLDRLCRVPAGPLRDELAFAPTVAGVRSGWIGRFASGDRTARRRLTAAFGEYHELAVAPYWQRIRAVLDAERTARAGVLGRDGVEAMFAGLAPALRWTAPVLEVPGYRGARTRPDDPPALTEVHLHGRGLLLAPSVFNSEDPGLYVPWNDDPALLIYRVALDAPAALRLWRRPGPPDGQALAALLGTTRAAALRAIAAGCTTTELARRLGISPGGASQHATVLREAGLVVSHRHRNTVRHCLTALGAGLLGTD